MTDITPIIGCDYIRSNGHIDETKGIFGILSEAFRRIKTGNIIPAHNNTKCACRKTKYCTMDCPSAVYGLMASGRISFRNKNATM